MPRFRLVVTDVDGTLTESRAGFRIHLRAIEAVRAAEDSGVTVSLSSGNSLPVMIGLTRYLGAAGPVIAENGCLVYWRGAVHRLCRGRPPAELIEEIRAAGLEYSWQNRYRDHDIAFPVPPGRDPTACYRRVAEIVEKHGWEGKVLNSGYAIHIQPPGGGKGAALRLAARLLGVDTGMVLAVGDSQNDVEMLRAAGAAAVPRDADVEAAAVASYIASKPAGLGFAEIIEKLVLPG